jgi:hypothetical protein
LLNQGEFVLIAEAAVHGRIAVDEEFLVSRALEHAMYEQDLPQLKIEQQPSGGYVSCSFDWPTPSWINAAKIEITSEDGKYSNFSMQKRLTNEPNKRSNFSLDAGFGLRPSLKVSWAIQLPSGSSVFCSKGTTIALNGNTNRPTFVPPVRRDPPTEEKPSVTRPPEPIPPTIPRRPNFGAVITPVQTKSGFLSRFRSLFKR